MTGFPPQGLPPSEGDFSTWAQYDKIVQTAVSSRFGQGPVTLFSSRDGTKLILISGAGLPWVYTISSKSFAILSGATVAGGPVIQGAATFATTQNSVLGKYVVLGDVNGNFQILKDGVVQQKLLLATYGWPNGWPAFVNTNAGIDRSGKWIVVENYVDANNDTLWIFQGT